MYPQSWILCIKAPRVFRTKSEKLALKVVDNYSLFLSGAMTEPDELIAEQLECTVKDASSNLYI